jgi:ankyrin repeat protein
MNERVARDGTARVLVVLIAARNGNAECVQALLAAGIDVNAGYAHDATALMWAAADGKDEAVRLLLSRGADPSVRDDRGESALSIAQREKQSATAALLQAALAAK